MKKLFLLTLIALVSVMTIVSCGTDDAASDETPQTTPLPKPLSKIEMALDMMPASESSRAFTRFNDWEAIAVAYGIERPGDDSTFEEFTAFRLQIAARGLEGGLINQGEEWLSGFNRDYFEEMPDTNVSLGFDARDVRFSAVSGERQRDPQPILEVVFGDFDGDMAEAFLNDCVMCAAPPEIKTHAGETFYSWGEDFLGSLGNRFGLPLFDEVGRGSRLYVADEHAARAMRTTDMEAFIDTNVGTGQSLLDIEEWALAASAMADLEAVSAVFTDQVDFRISEFPEILGMMPANIDNFGEDVMERYEMFDEISATVTASSPELPVFEVAATGSGWDGDEAYSAMAIVFADEETAERGLDALRDRAESGLFVAYSLETGSWSDLIVSAEFTIDGRVVSAKIYPVDRDDIEGPFLRSAFVMQVPFTTTKAYVPFLLR